MSQNSTCVLACTSLLREHLHAIKTYQETLKAHPLSPRNGQLERILGIHEKSASELRTILTKLEALPVDASGSWNRQTTQLAHPQEITDDGPDVLSLLRREESALARCEEILLLPGLGKEAADCIRDTVVPRFQKNVAVLERMQETVLQALPIG